MNYRIKNVWDIPESAHTAESVFTDRKLHRRELLQTLAMSVGTMTGISAIPFLAGCSEPQPEEVLSSTTIDPLVEAYGSHYPASRLEQFEYGRAETERLAAASYTNFFEFTPTKAVYQYVAPFQPTPWKIEVTGLCAKPMTFDLDDLYQKFALEERAYRHRCVETWAMCVPWTGFALRHLLDLVEPTAQATHVEFKTFSRPAEAPNMSNTSFPWPYTEGLTIAEAMNDLTLLSLGIFGAPLLKQHGAPVRLVVPWKYGFKGIKSITEIHLTNRQPATFWNTLNPAEYQFESNVDPAVRHPRWSQETEWMLGTKERFPTQKYNGYADHVANLYPT
ncbi:MAG: protein-methionine-sulfoxide reductase catalytic subunit MsrP [Planctomycetaceae bacterium]